MPHAPSHWNVVILGSWNRAILTPKGIAKRLFCLEADTPVEVHIPIDVLAPYHVRYDSLTVIASSSRLVIETGLPNLEQLEKAKLLGRTAIKALPETPFLGAGINLKYDYSGDAEALQGITNHDSDTRLSDCGYEIVGRGNFRTIEWKKGPDQYQRRLQSSGQPIQHSLQF